MLPKDLAGEPGTPAPQLAITFNAWKISTIDLYGRRFVLLAGSNGAAWILAPNHMMQRLGVPLDTYRFGIELGSAEAAAAHHLETDGALLVRPDGFVAWRIEASADDHEHTLEHVMCRLLCRTPSAS
jgi:putative polyketide hydroxylase